MTILELRSSPLPPLQNNFLSLWDGTCKGALECKHFARIINPCFTSHYFYVSGDTPETTITTLSTDGSYAGIKTIRANSYSPRST